MALQWNWIHLDIGGRFGPVFEYLTAGHNMARLDYMKLDNLFEMDNERPLLSFDELGVRISVVVAGIQRVRTF